MEGKETRQVLLDQVRDELRRILANLEHEAETSLFRELCALARSTGVDPYEFRRLLVEAHLRQARASEITRVLLHDEVCRRFVEGLSWKQALDQARDEAGDPALRAAAILVGRLLDLGDLWPRGAKFGPWTRMESAEAQFYFQSEEAELSVNFRSS